MDEVSFRCAGETLVACHTGALWWPAARLLCVADLHLGRAGRLARRGGGLLPPYDSATTIARLAGAVERYDPRRVICLGDSFDDAHCADELGPAAAQRLAALAAGRDWLWIAGNHDPAPIRLAGTACREARIGPLRFRHHPGAYGCVRGEVAGHLHPKLRRRFGGRTLSRRCFVHDARRVILPAFGSYVGGMDVDAPAVAELFEPATARAILTGHPCLSLPLGRAAPARYRSV